MNHKSQKQKSDKGVIREKNQVEPKSRGSKADLKRKDVKSNPAVKAKSAGRSGVKPLAKIQLQSSGKKSSLREVFSELNSPLAANRKQSANVTEAAIYKYYLIYKPYGMMSQFSRENEKATLADIKFDFPADVYPVGRLDADTEGLLLLTNNTSINDKLLNPKNAHKRTYLAQVDGAVTEDAVRQLKKGITITVDGKAYKTLPAEVKIVKTEPSFPPRNPPIRVRANIPTSWLELTLIEGKNHQVRKMCAKAGFPVLRLIRTKIGNLNLENLQPGKVKELTERETEILVSNS